MDSKNKAQLSPKQNDKNMESQKNKEKVSFSKEGKSVARAEGTGRKNMKNVSTAGTHEQSAAFMEILTSIHPQTAQAHPSKTPIIAQLTNILHATVRHSRHSILPLNVESETSPDRKSISRLQKFHNLVRRARKSMGAENILKELRLRREEYIINVEQALNKKKSHEYDEDHPYVALRKRIEAMARTGKEEYKVQYEPFSNKHKYDETNIPIYATDYDDERKRQARRRQFMFGLVSGEGEHRYDPDKIDTYVYDPTDKSEDRSRWKSTTETNVAALALVFSASNLFRFPHACYVNGGIIFFLVYCFLMVALIQPLILFEMLIGQFSYKGEWGFGLLHRYSKGFPYALAFVTVTFVTLNNAILGYTGLYAIGATSSNPGLCDASWSAVGQCIPYSEVEKFPVLVNEKRIWIEKHFNDDHMGFYDEATLFFSTELFFRFYILSWKGKYSSDFFHWKYVTTFIIVLIIIIPATINSHLVSAWSRMWVYFAMILPILLSILLFHQYAFRNGYNTPRYFSYFNWDRVATLTFWSDAFQMALTTVGVGYGIIIRSSSRNMFTFTHIRKTSWFVSFFVMIVCLLCCMVVYTELAILGLISDAKQFTHILTEGFGVSFVCVSGALLKFGPQWIFTSFFAWLTIFNIWPQILATNMSITYINSWLPIKNTTISKCTAIGITAVYEVALISLYASHAGFAFTDSFDLFGGSGAACMIVLTEIGIAFILFGFREFMTDIEIMLDTPLPFSYQIRMKYFIPPSIIMAFFIIALTWFESPPVLIESRHTSRKTFHLGIFLNSMPIIIMIVFAYIAFRNRNKVAPIHENVKISEKKRGVKKYFKTQARWKDRRGAVLDNMISNPSVHVMHGRNALKTERAGAEEAYFAHVDLKENLRNLFAEVNAKALWNDLANKIIVKKKFKSLQQTTSFLMRQKETETQIKEARFLKNIIQQCSISDLTVCSSKNLPGKSLDNQEILLLNKLLKKASFSTEESSDSNESGGGDCNEHKIPTASWFSKTTCVPLQQGCRSSSSSDHSYVYKRVVGKPVITSEETRLDLSVRIKKALGLPYGKELAGLRILRNRRLRKESEVITRYDALPEEQFITLKITKHKESPFFIGVRVIIIPSRNHFVLKRLPIPRPLVFRTTNTHISSFPGSDRNHKIYEFVMSCMKAPIWKADVSKLLQPSSRVPLLENLHEDIYTFFDPLKTCIVVIESDKEAKWRNYKWRWLTRPTRRKHKWEEIPLMHEPTFEVEGATYLELADREEKNKRITKLINEPSDIVYHPPDRDNDIITPDDSSVWVTSNSSSSGSVNSSKANLRFQKGNIELVDELTLQANKIAFQKKFRHPETEMRPRKSKEKSLGRLDVKHLTNDDWRRRKDQHHVPLVTIHEKDKPFNQSTQMVSNVPVINITEEKLEIPSEILSIIPVWSQFGEDRLRIKRTEVQLDTRFVKDFSNLKNECKLYNYSTCGKTLVVEPKPKEQLFLTAAESCPRGPNSSAVVPLRKTGVTSLPKNPNQKARSVSPKSSSTKLQHKKSNLSN